jgi:GNAT superfamily N-acetyltransferase
MFTAGLAPYMEITSGKFLAQVTTEVVMDNQFTLHCIAWQAAAPLLLETRLSACEIGLLSLDELLSDEMDDRSRHALVLGKTGRAIGCARLTPQGIIDRLAVLPHEQRAQIEAAMIEALNDYARENKRARNAAIKAKPKSQPGRLAA